MKRLFDISVLLLAGAMSAPGAEPKPAAVDKSTLPPPATGSVDFVRDIQPVLADRCYSCHGPEKQKGGLRLDRKQDALAGGDNGKVIIRGQSAESLLIQNVAGLDPDNLMPPKGERLTANQIGLLRAWIDAGAPWPETAALSTLNHKPSTNLHWSFKALQLPPLPKVNGATWVRNPIDAFVLARLEQEGLKPAPEADRPTLIRRLSFDLLGLPPAPDEVSAFLADRRPDAYERLVDRLLSSPHYGERWGRHWLDLARYADSDGYEKDNVRPYAYLYRDWVIDAINRDVPFDEFSILQLAGDLLPDATLTQKTATGFHRQTLTNTEGGVDQEEFRCKATVDRVSTTGAVWLGLTLGCAECHSHKYDPITQREFYQLYAFFSNASETNLPAPQPAELEKFQREKAEWDGEHAALKEPLDTYVKNELPAKQAAWEQSFQVPETRWIVLEATNLVSAGGAKLKVLPDRSVEVTGEKPDTDTYTIEAAGDFKGITGFRLEVLDDPAPDKGPGRGKKNNFVLSEFTVQLRQGTNDVDRRPVLLQAASADYAPTNWPVAGAIDANPKTGWAIEPRFDQRHVAAFETREPFDLPPGARLVFALDQQQGDEQTIGRFRISVTTSPRPLRADLTPDSVVEILRTVSSRRTDQQREELTAWFRDEVDSHAIKLKRKLDAHARKEPKSPPTTVATLAENEPRRRTHIHTRGDFLRKGDEVQPATLEALHPFRARGEKPDRLDLARWLMDPANPLTSRVTVNRIWLHLFGRGLTTSVNDFGMRGEPPSHPELLDWLAVTFMSPASFQLSTFNSQPACGWSQKALIKLIVNSATYRQSSHLRPELMDRDPNNMLLARQNRFRLEAENIRDLYLAVSGLFNPAIGGPSIRPPLPADIAALGYANSVKWKESEAAEKYRRGLYIFFQRTVPYPMLTTFDAPDSNVTCTRRERSNTPLQSLTLLNDPVFFECAQALGRRLAAEPGLRAEEKVARAFELCLSRAPSREERERLEQFYEGQLRLVQGNVESAVQMVGNPKADTNTVAEAATLVALGRTLMNLDEFVTRE